MKCCDKEVNSVLTVKATARAEKYCHVSSHKK
jgi:hypothetical protein